MKRSALIEHLEHYRCSFHRHGSEHDVYRNPTNGKQSTVPRHTEIPNRLAEKICKDLGIPKPR